MIGVSILTVSDSSAKGTREDLSGPAVAERCEQLGWSVQHRAVCADEVGSIEGYLRGMGRRVRYAIDIDNWRHRHFSPRCYAGGDLRSG